VSHDFEVGTNVSCEESTVSPRMGLSFCFLQQTSRVSLVCLLINTIHSKELGCICLINSFTICDYKKVLCL